MQRLPGSAGSNKRPARASAGAPDGKRPRQNSARAAAIDLTANDDGFENAFLTLLSQAPARAISRGPGASMDNPITAASVDGGPMAILPASCARDGTTFVEIGEHVRWIQLEPGVDPELLQIVVRDKGLSDEFIGVFRERETKNRQDPASVEWEPAPVECVNEHGETWRLSVRRGLPFNADAKGALPGGAADLARSGRLILSPQWREQWNRQFDGMCLTLTLELKRALGLAQPTQADYDHFLQSFEGLNCVAGLEASDGPMIRKIAHALETCSLTLDCKGAATETRSIIVTMDEAHLDLRSVGLLESVEIAVFREHADLPVRSLIQSMEGTAVWVYPECRKQPAHLIANPRRDMRMTACPMRQNAPHAARFLGRPEDARVHAETRAARTLGVQSQAIDEVVGKWLPPALANVVGQYLTLRDTKEPVALRKFCALLEPFAPDFEVFGCHDGHFRQALEAAKFRIWRLAADDHEVAAYRAKVGDEAFGRVHRFAQDLYGSSLFVRSAQFNVASTGNRETWGQILPRGSIVAVDLANKHADQSSERVRDLRGLAGIMIQLKNDFGRDDNEEEFRVPALYPGLVIAIGSSSVRLARPSSSGGWEVDALDKSAPKFFGKPEGSVRFAVEAKALYAKCLHPVDADEPGGQNSAIQAWAQWIGEARFNLMRLAHGAADPVQSLKETLKSAMQPGASQLIVMGVADGLRRVSISPDAVHDPDFLQQFAVVVHRLMPHVREIAVSGPSRPADEPQALARLREEIATRETKAPEPCPADGFALLVTWLDRLPHFPDGNSLELREEAALAALSHVSVPAAQAFAKARARSLPILELGAAAASFNLDAAVLAELPFDAFHLPQPASGKVVNLRGMDPGKPVRFTDWTRGDCVIHAPAELPIELPAGKSAEVSYFHLGSSSSYKRVLKGAAVGLPR